MKYEVIVKTETTVYVEAASEEEAEHLACLQAWCEDPDEVVCWTTEIK